MSDHFTRKEHPIKELIDHFSSVKMSSLTRLGRMLLPAGFWHHDDTPRLSNADIYLTFDDGPNPKTTPYLLELLEEENVKATFFLIGKHVEKHPKIVEMMYEKGHTLGNHSHRHLFIPALPIKLIEHEIHTANHRIEDITGEMPTLFRPPYGLIDQRAADCLSERGMTPVYWGAVPEDWDKIGARSVVKRVMKQIAPGSMIVLHEMDHTIHQTVSATREIIRQMKQSGYKFGTIHQTGAA